MNEKSVGILYALRQLYAADGTTLPRKAVAGLIDDVLSAEAAQPDKSDWIGQIRAYGHKLIAGGAGMVQAVRIICAQTGLTKQDFADLIGTSRTTVSLALNGRKVRETLVRKMAEFFMIDNNKED